MNPTGILAIALLVAVFVGVLYTGHGHATTEPAPATQPEHDGPPCMVTYPDRCHDEATTDTHGWLTCARHAPRSAA